MVIRLRPELSGFTASKARDSPITLYLFGWYKLDSVKLAIAPNRQHFLAGVRKAQLFRSTSFIFAIFEVSTPPKRGRALQNVEFVEASRPLALSAYSDSVSSVGPPLQHTQEMVNEISEALPRAASSPPYKPYIEPGFSARPWLPRMETHGNAHSNCHQSASRLPGKHYIALKMWLRRHLRFVFAVGLCRAWDCFGCLPPQLSHFVIPISLAATGNCNYAMLYHKALVRILTDAARASIAIDSRRYLAEIKDGSCKAIPRGANQSARPNTIANPASRWGDGAAKIPPRKKRLFNGK